MFPHWEFSFRLVCECAGRYNRSMADQPWYHDGLAFECTQCGNCCTGAPGVVWVSEEEVQAIAQHLQQPVGAVRLLQTRIVQGKVSLREHLNGDCIYFDPSTRGCTVYPVRPLQCRTWPFWEGNVKTPDDWARTRAECPGAGRGNIVPLEQIQYSVQRTNQHAGRKHGGS